LNTFHRPASPTDCPDDSCLSSFVNGRLPPSLHQQVAVHLASCPRCRSIFDESGGVAEASPHLAAGGFAPLVGQHAPAAPGSQAVTTGGADTADGERLSARPMLTIRFGQYQLLEVLGKGGMGVVYKARHLSLNRLVALKVLQFQNPHATIRFRREMLALGALRHPNLVEATDAGEIDGVPYLVMEYVAGLDLARLSSRLGPLPVADACEAIRQAALGLQAIHEQGLVHRDVKPSNLILTPEGRVKVLDLGLVLPDGGGSAEDLTTANQFMGTADYAAPEQADAHSVDIRADIYSLGCTLFKLLTGKAPYSTAPPSVFHKLKAHAEMPAPSLAGHRQDAPTELVGVLSRLLAKDREQRPATPLAVAQELAPLYVGSSLAALVQDVPPQRDRPVADPPASGRPRRWTPVRLALLGAAVLAAVGLGVAAPWISRRADPPEKSEPLREATPTWTFPDPKPLKIPAPLAEFRCALSEDRTTLEVSAGDFVMVPLGTCEGNFDFEVGFKTLVTRPISSVGVFFGYHQEPDQGVHRVRYQALVYQRAHPGGVAETRYLERYAGGQSSTELVGRQRITRAAVKDNRLGITVSGGKLTSVRWNGEEMGLTDSLKTGASGRCAGTFGVWCSSATAIFTKGSIHRRR
jgi:serine/threonine protein kinase